MATPGTGRTRALLPGVTTTTVVPSGPEPEPAAGPAAAGNQAVNAALDQLLQQQLAQLGLRPDQPGVQQSATVAKRVVAEALRASILGNLGLAEGAGLFVTGLVDSAIFIPYAVINAVDYTVRKAGESGGLTPDQIAIAQTLAHLALLDHAALLKPIRSGLATAGMYDELTDAPVVSPLVTRLGDQFEPWLNQTLGLPAETGLLTAREAAQIVGNLGLQALFAETGGREVQLVVQVLSVLGGVRAAVMEAIKVSRRGEKWYLSPEFWTSVGAIALTLAGIKYGSAAGKLLNLFVAVGVGALSAAPPILEYAYDWVHYHKPDREKKLHQDLVAVCNAVLNALAQIITHAVKPSSGSPRPDPERPAPPAAPAAAGEPAATPSSQSRPKLQLVPNEPDAAPSTRAASPGAGAAQDVPERALPTAEPAAGNAPRPGTRSPVRRRQQEGTRTQRSIKRRGLRLGTRTDAPGGQESQRRAATGTTGEAPPVTGKGPRLVLVGEAGEDVTSPRASADTPESPGPAADTPESPGPTVGGPEPVSEAAPTSTGAGKKPATGKKATPEAPALAPATVRRLRRVRDLILALPKGASRQQLKEHFTFVLKGLRSGDLRPDSLDPLEFDAQEATRLNTPAGAADLRALKAELHQAAAEKGISSRLRADLQELIARIGELEKELTKNPDQNTINVREELEKVKRQWDRAGRQEYAVHVDMNNPTNKATILQELAQLTEGMVDHPGGAEARKVLLAKVRALDEMDLGQSVRGTGAGRNAYDTQELRARFAEYVKRGGLGAEYRTAFLEACGNESWPSTHGQPWQLDHIIELWQSGAAQDLTNIIALDPALHSEKTQALAEFRRHRLDQNRPDSGKRAPNGRPLKVEDVQVEAPIELR